MKLRRYLTNRHLIGSYGESWTTMTNDQYEQLLTLDHEDNDEVDVNYSHLYAARKPNAIVGSGD